MKILYLLFTLLIILPVQIVSQQDTLQIAQQINCPGQRPSNLTYHGEKLWILDDSLKVVYSLTKDGQLLDSIKVSINNPIGITFRNDNLWIINNISIGDTLIAWYGDSAVMPLYNLYEINKSNGAKSDSIKFIGIYKRHLDFLGLEYYNLKYYVSCAPVWGATIIEIDPNNNTKIDLCCEHPSDMTIYENDLWGIRSWSNPDDRSSPIYPISINSDSGYASGLIEDGFHTNFIANGICYDGENFWLLDSISMKINKMSKLPTNVFENNYEPSNHNRISMEQNYPNPFNPTTNIFYFIPERDFIIISIYDIMGSKIKTLVSETKNEGNFKVEFDGSNLPSGIYFYRISTQNYSETKKMVLIR